MTVTKLPNEEYNIKLSRMEYGILAISTMYGIKSTNSEMFNGIHSPEVQRCYSRANQFFRERKQTMLEAGL